MGIEPWLLVSMMEFNRLNFLYTYYTTSLIWCASSWLYTIIQENLYNPQQYHLQHKVLFSITAHYSIWFHPPTIDSIHESMVVDTHWFVTLGSSFRNSNTHKDVFILHIYSCWKIVGAHKDGPTRIYAYLSDRKD